MGPEPGWHPLVIHFPIALTLTAGVLLAAAKLVRNDALAATLATVGTWNLCMGAVAALFALATGLAAVLDLQVGAAAHAAIATHVKWAMFTTLALILTAVWRGAGQAQQSRPTGLFLFVLTLTCLALAVAGYHGGENVYRYGIGVDPRADAAMAKDWIRCKEPVPMALIHALRSRSVSTRLPD